MNFSFTKKIISVIAAGIIALSSSFAASASDTTIPQVAQTIFQDMGYNPYIQAKDMVIVYMDDDFDDPEAHDIHKQIELNDKRKLYSDIAIDLQKLVAKSENLPSTEAHYSNVTYSHADYQGERAVVCQLWGNRKELFDRLNQDATLRDLDLISHEISHCQLSRSASRFEALEQRYPGVYIWTHQKMDAFMSQNPEMGRGLGRYVVHVQEVFADIGSIMYLYNNTEFSEDEKLAFIADLRDHRKKYDPFKYNSVVTHYTGYYLDHILKNPNLLKDAYRAYQRDPIVAVFDIAYEIGKDYSLKYDAFQNKFSFSN